MAACPPCLVSTLGMFILDQFRFEDEETGIDLGDRGLGVQIGGGGTYFAIGARMWLPPREVLMTVDRGKDFRAQEQELMDMYAKPCIDEHHSLWRYRDRGEQTTRAVNIYRGQQRGFAYLTPKLRLDPTDLLSTSSPHFPTFIHCICSPERAADICDQIDSSVQFWYQGRRPRVVWEPIPDSAVPENLDGCLAVMGRVDVISPNHEEAAAFLSIGKEALGGDKARSSIKTLVLDQLFEKSAAAKLEKVPVICIRSGALGALVAINDKESAWVEAYHRPREAERVVDVTGAGNAWLGGFTALLAKTSGGGKTDSWSLEQVSRAAQAGSVSASFVVEQQSLPLLSTDEQGLELWNGEQPSTRLHCLQDRRDCTPLPQ